MTDRPNPHQVHSSSPERSISETSQELQRGLDNAHLDVGEGRRVESASVIEALVRLANDTKAGTRTVAVTELERLLPRAAESPELHTAIVRQIPHVATSIRVATDLGVLTDLFRLAGEIGYHGEREIRSCTGGVSSKDRAAALQDLASAILAKLYEPNRTLPEIVAESGIVALWRFRDTTAGMVRPLLHAFELAHPSNHRVAFGCNEIRRLDDERAALEPPPSRGFPAIVALFGLKGLMGRARWGEAESAAVETLVGTFNNPPDLPPPYDPASSALLAAHEQRIREAIRVLGRFGSRNKADLEPADSVRAAVALTTCLSSPLHDSKAIAALSLLGAGAAPALPALIEVGSSRRFSNTTRGEALEAIGRIIAAAPEIDCSDARGVGGRFLEITSRVLDGSNPLLIQKSLQALAAIGPRGAALASSIEYVLCHDLDSTPSPGEDEDAALQPIALYAIEALAAVDPSGDAAGKTFSRIFDAARTPDDIRQQLIIAVGELAEREEIPVPIVDTITARMIESRHLPEYLAEEALAMTQRVEHTLDLHPAELPLTTTALLRSRKLDTPAKEARLMSLVSGAGHYPQSILGILMASYPELSPVARLDDIALETLRRLRP